MPPKRKGLGKGLDSMFPSYTDNPRNKEKPEEIKENDETEKTEVEEKKEDTGRNNGGVVMLKISDVEPNREQPRTAFNEDSLQELSESIRQYGVIQPLIVQKNGDSYLIVAGERRWRAAKLAGLKEVPVLIKDYSDLEVMEISLIENIQREDLNPIEEALAYEKLLEEFKMKQDELAEKVSKSRTTITNSLRLLKLDPRVRQMLIDEMLSTGHARALLALSDGQQQYETAQRIFEEKLSVREVEKLVKKILNPAQLKDEDKKESSNAALDLICAQMEERMKAALGTKVSVNRKTAQKGKIEIEYYSADELERIYELLRGLE